MKHQLPKEKQQGPSRSTALIQFRLLRHWKLWSPQADHPQSPRRCVAFSTWPGKQAGRNLPKISWSRVLANTAILKLYKQLCAWFLLIILLLFTSKASSLCVSAIIDDFETMTYYYGYFVDFLLFNICYSFSHARKCFLCISFQGRRSWLAYFFYPFFKPRILIQI